MFPELPQKTHSGSRAIVAIGIPSPSVEFSGGECSSRMHLMTIKQASEQAGRTAWSHHALRAHCLSSLFSLTLLLPRNLLLHPVPHDLRLPGSVCLLLLRELLLLRFHFGNLFVCDLLSLTKESMKINTLPPSSESSPSSFTHAPGCPATFAPRPRAFAAPG